MDSLWRQTTGILKKAVAEIYPYYEAGDVETFYKKCIKITKFLNQGKLTKKQDQKAHSIYRSLDMIKNLDEDYCEFLVNKYLSKDEFVELDDVKRELKIWKYLYAIHRVRYLML